jgi:predicted nucleic acid-binding protein
MRIFLEAQAKMYVQGLVRDKKINLACSYMSSYENNDNPNIEHRDIITDFLTNAIVYIDYDKADEVENRAEALKKLGLKKKDSIHLASAIEAECDYFITTDDGILKKYEVIKQGHKINACTPVDFLNVLEELNA